MMTNRDRIAWCGAIAQYHTPHNPPAAPRNLYNMVGKQLRLQGFPVRDHMHLQSELEQLLIPHIQAGRAVSDETIVDAIGHTVEAFLAMLHGQNIGKLLVRVSG